MKFLPVLPLRKKYYAEIEKEINRLLDEILYAPLFEIVREPKKEKANERPSPLAEAIIAGRISYIGGVFKGLFTSAISKELRDMGAIYSKWTKDWALAGPLPPAIYAAIGRAEIDRKRLQNKLTEKLAQIDISRMDQISDLVTKYRDSIVNMDLDFKQAVQGITVAPQLLPAQANALAADWTYNLDLYIKKWTAQNIIDLRHKVMDEAFAGNRPKSFEKMIMENYGVGRRKAKFLARQETALLMSKFHEQRYRDVGSTKYKWSTSHDERVRSDHKKLNGKIISWDNPPVVDLNTGRRAHAGEDFNCRCVAIAIID